MRIYKLKKNVLVLGSGGREHAMVWSFKNDDYVKKVRFFVDPLICDQLRAIDNLIGLVEESLNELGDSQSD